MHNYPSDADMVTAWALGLEEAQTKLRQLGVHPDNELHDAEQNLWFFQPELIDATTEAGIEQQMAVDDELIDVRVHQENFHVEAEAEAMNMVSAELQTHLRQVAQDSDNDMETGDNRNEGKKVSATIQVPDVGPVHKATFFSLLNSNPNGELSKDRLKRVRARSTTQTGSVITSNEIGIHDDVAVYIKDAGQPGRFSLGRIQRMRNKEKGTVEYTKPISLANQEKYPKLQLLMSMYQTSSITDGEVFVYKATDAREFSLCDILPFQLIHPSSRSLNFLLEIIAHTCRCVCRNTQR